MSEAPSVSLNQAIDRAAALLATDAAAAEQAARAALARSPRDPRAALILASALRRRGDAPGALAILRPLAAAYPNAALTQYELGAALTLAGAPGGIEALRRAASLNPSHAEAWRALGEALFAEGDNGAAEAAFAQHRRARVRDPRLKPAAEALFAGRLAEAEQALRRSLVARPDDPPALQMLADVLARRARFAEAEALLARCLELAPGLDGARFAYADALFHQQKGAQAAAELERLVAADPANPAYGNLMAACLELAGDFGRALAIYERLLGPHGRQPLLWLNYGHMLRTVGRRDDAASAYRRATRLNPALGEAYLGLANLETPLTAGEAAAMAREVERPELARRDRAYLSFALGRALEARGDDAGAFASYARGAALRRAETPYDAGAFTAYVEACAGVFTAEFFGARRDFGAEADDPIFIVGLHRSGSTLIEQILASHSQVEGTMELPDVGLAARDLGWSRPGARHPACLAGLSRDRAAAFGRQFIEATRAQRRLGRRFFVDKMPNNFQHLGLIQLMLPRAKIIDARRHPCGACVSAFKQHFADAQPFTYDLGDLGRYYRDYVALMEHFDAALPGRVHRVIYEDLVEDTEAEVRRLLAHCGLDFEPACLAFHENDRAVRTVSSEQVRRPIYREGLDQWRRFEPWLDPLKEALGPALTRWRGRG